jgi:anti-anti-sigma factor
LPDTAVLAPRATAVGPPWFSCRRSDCASTVRLSVSGELDIATAPQLDHALGCAQADAALVILDLRELEFMDSSGANLIAAASGRARQASDRLVVVRGPVQVERIFALVGVDRQLELVDHPPATPSAAVPDGVQP